MSAGGFRSKLDRYRSLILIKSNCSFYFRKKNHNFRWRVQICSKSSNKNKLTLLAGTLRSLLKIWVISFFEGFSILFWFNFAKNLTQTSWPSTFQEENVNWDWQLTCLLSSWSQMVSVEVQGNVSRHKSLK